MRLLMSLRLQIHHGGFIMEDTRFHSGNVQKEVPSISKERSSNMRKSIHFDTGQWPELWQATCRLLEQTIVPNQLHAWIHPLDLAEIEEVENGLRVKMNSPNDFSAQWVRDHYQKAIEAA